MDSLVGKNFGVFLDRVLAEIDNHKMYFDKLDLEKLQDALIRTITLIKSENLLSIMSRQRHIINQWKIAFEHPKSSDVAMLKRSVKRLQLSPNAQAGCERSNSKYARFKTKYSNTMGIEIVRARSRTGENGPPVIFFPRNLVLSHWMKENHRLALKVKETDKSLVLLRKKKKAQEQYTSRIFCDLEINC